MGSKIASSCPPMTLREREILDAIQLGFLIPPLPGIFQATATQVLTKKMLEAFINHLLSTIHYDNSITETPSVGCWGLEGSKGGFFDLESWDPRQTSQDVYKVIALPIKSDPRTLTPIYPQWAILGRGLQQSSIKSIQLPSQEVFEFRGSQLLLVIHCRIKVKLTNKKARIEEKKYNILIPTDLKVIDLVKVFKVIGNVSGIVEMIEFFRNIQTSDTRTATDLGWRHGTELRLEMS